MGAFDVHEVIVTKGDVQKSPQHVKDAINDFGNCVAIHPECHPEAITKEMQTKLTEFLFRARRELVEDFVGKMKEYGIPIDLHLNMYTQPTNEQRLFGYKD